MACFEETQGRKECCQISALEFSREDLALMQTFIPFASDIVERVGEGNEGKCFGTSGCKLFLFEYVVKGFSLVCHLCEIAISCFCLLDFKA